MYGVLLVVLIILKVNSMAHLIDKDALVAEIERMKADALQKKEQCKRSGLERIMHQIGAYNKILSFINALEVKEVDLEEYIENEVKHYGLSLYEASYGTFSASQIDRIIRNAFELGVEARQG